MNEQEKGKFLKAHELRAEKAADSAVLESLGACVSCTKRHSCNEIGNSLRCETLKLSAKQAVLNLRVSDNA